MKKLNLFIFFILLVASVSAQNTNSWDDIIYPEKEVQERLYLFGYNPITRELLSESPYPYPVTGTPDDGIPDKIQFMVSLRAPKGVVDFETFMEASSTRLNIDFIRDGEPGMLDDPNMLGSPDYSDVVGNIPNKVLRNDMDWDYIDINGEIDLSFDILQEMRLGYKAFLEFPDGNVSNAFTAYVTAANPELTMHSKLKSGGFIMDGVTLTSVVSGRTALAFDSDYGTLKGRGPLTYEMFDIESSTEGCNITTKTKDGAWRVEVVFPDGEALIDANLERPSQVPPPQEVVTMIEPTIRESGTIRCPRGIPPILPLPRLIHFFALFFSFHGGEIPVAGQETPNELNEDRGGLVMTDWLPGTGNIIATRSYKRVGTRDNATFEEDTELVLKWPGIENIVPVCHQNDNGETMTIFVNESELQTHLAHGDYEGECLVPVCHQLGNCEPQTIHVNESEVQTHLAHGDYKGECYDCCFSEFLELESYTRFCNTLVDGIGTFYIAGDNDGFLKITADPGSSKCEFRSSSGTLDDTNISFDEAKACLQVLICIANELELEENCD